jgi:hypothetical protein
MAYTTDQAALLASQLERLATSGAHQIAGQFANLEFWLAEAVHVLATITDYPQRFRQLRDAQSAWVTTHGTRVSGPCAHCGGRCELGPHAPPPPTRISSDEMDAARRGVRRGLLSTASAVLSRAPARRASAASRVRAHRRYQSRP